MFIIEQLSSDFERKKTGALVLRYWKRMAYEFGIAVEALVTVYDQANTIFIH